MKTIDQQLTELKKIQEYNAILYSLIGNLNQQYKWYDDDNSEHGNLMRVTIVTLAQDIANLAK